MVYYRAMITVFFSKAITRSARAIRRDGSLVLPWPPVVKGRVAKGSNTGVDTSPPAAAPSAPRRVRIAAAAIGVARASLVAVVVFHMWYILSTSLLVACFAFVDPAATTLSVYRKYVDGWKIVKPVTADFALIPKTARRMLISIEDYTFYEHHGIDLKAFERAYEINQKLGRPMYGGSTLTMQTARTLFLVPFKSYLRKYLEVIVAFELELLLSKERILELYFSWAEWGKGVFGIETASKLYYKVPVSKLSATQMARLMAVLSSPIRFTPATLQKSGLLAWRFEFLMDRYVR